MKSCSLCGLTKNDTEFYVSKIGRLSSRCKKCARAEALEQFRKMTKEEKREKRNKERDKLREKMTAFYEKSRCADCGIDDPVVLVFHHEDPGEKEDTISRMLAHRKGWKTIQKELDKCVCLCANCHMRRHHEMGDYRDYLRS